jgi:hypothetical protein
MHQHSAQPVKFQQLSTEKAFQKAFLLPLIVKPLKKLGRQQVHRQP